MKPVRLLTELLSDGVILIGLAALAWDLLDIPTVFVQVVSSI